ncbi:MAG: alpha/beta hydrolase [Phenylobacterium sp.]
MRRMMIAAALALAPLALAATAWGQAIPAPVVSDPTTDAAHPPHQSQVLAPSGGVGMNALFYLAGGAGPHPTVVLFHGLPGNEQNLDLAQAIRRAGWNVLTLHYRGSWGSPGTFSIAHVQEDAQAAKAFVRDPKIAAKFGIDTRRIVLAGHSMGGFAAVSAARDDKALAGVIFLDGWNAGRTGAQLSALEPAARKQAAELRFDDFGNSLAGATPISVVDEAVVHQKDWDVRGWAPRLTAAPLLVIGAAKANGAENHAIAQAVAAAGGHVTDVTLPTDHPFSDHRIALAGLVVSWLQALPN